LFRCCVKGGVWGAGMFLVGGFIGFYSGESGDAPFLAAQAGWDVHLKTGCCDSGAGILDQNWLYRWV